MNPSLRSGLAGAALLLACGGHTAKYTVDEVSLAQVPVADKQAIFDASNEVSVAKAEKAKADADVDTTRQEIHVAEAERDQARLEVDKTKVEAEMADKAQDANKQQAAADQRRAADLGKRAAEAKVDMLDAKRKWQNALVDQADAHIDSAVSKVELEKAKLAAAKNIRPSKDFEPAKFSEDYNKRVRHLDDTRITADKKKEKFDRALAEYNNLKSQCEQAKIK